MRLEHTYWERFHLQDDRDPNNFNMISESIAYLFYLSFVRTTFGTPSATFIFDRSSTGKSLGILYWPTAARRSRTKYDDNAECSYLLSFMEFGPVPNPIIELLSRMKD